MSRVPNSERIEKQLHRLTLLELIPGCTAHLSGGGPFFIFNPLVDCAQTGRVAYWAYPDACGTLFKRMIRKSRDRNVLNGATSKLVWFTFEKRRWGCTDS